MKKSITLLVSALLSTAFIANAVPAKRGLRTVVQPDGTTVEVQKVGDEFAHYYTDKDGMPMLRDNDGFIRYIRVDTNGQLSFSATKPAASTKVATENLFIAKGEARRAEKASTTRDIHNGSVRMNAQSKASSDLPQKGLGLFSNGFPTEGDIKSLVFLVEYKDKKFTVDNPAEYFEEMLNGDNFTAYNATGSARKYFLDQSHNTFRPTFDVYGPYTLPNKKSYYGGGNEDYAYQMVTHAATALDSQINFADYDLNHDGYVDNIYVIYAGFGEASSYDEDSVWPHSWDIPDYLGITCDGVKISRYACSNEMEGNTPDGIGTFVHEFSHVMGLPDLYATSSTLTVTPDKYSCMDYGPYNNDGRTPPNYGAYERNALGWMDARVISDPESISLEAIHKSNDACLVQTSRTNEFFLFENRQQEGWDAYIPGHGMLIWHIDYNESVWSKNTVNNLYSHQYVDIIEAGGTANSADDAIMESYPFPGTKKVTSFTESTNPRFENWNKVAIDVPITEISENNGIITFNVSGGLFDLSAPTNVKATATNKGTIEFSWDAVDHASDYILNIYTKDSNGNHVALLPYKDYRTGNSTSFEAEGVMPETLYFFTVAAASGKIESSATDEQSVLTPVLGFEYTTPVALEATEGNLSGFTAIWAQHPGATAYLLTVEALTMGGDETTTMDFGNSTSKITIPAGWQYSGDYSEIYKSTSNGFFGESAPSVKMKSDGVQLVSCVFENAIKKVGMWIRGANANSQSTFDVEGRKDNSSNWQNIATLSPFSLYNTKGQNLSYDVAGNDYHQVRFVYHKSSGNAALDDIVITTGGEAIEILDGFNALNVGNELSRQVNELPTGATKFNYYVEAIDANGAKSRKSNKVSVDLSKLNSGICEIAQVSQVLRIDGMSASYRGEAGAQILIRNLAGITIAAHHADSTGSADFILPASGFYLISVPEGTAKAYVR